MTALFGLAPFGTGVVPCDGARFRWLHDTMLCRTRLCWVCLHWHWLRRHLPLVPLRYSMCCSCRLVLLLNRLCRRSRWQRHRAPLLCPWLLCHAVHPILHVLPLEPRLWRRLSARLYHSVFTSPSSDSTSTVVICVGGGPFGGGPGLGGGPTGGLSSSECVTPGTTG